MKAHHAFDKGEAKAGTLMFATRDIIDLDEGLHNLWNILKGYPDAIVNDLEYKAAFFLTPGLESDCAASAREFDRIGKQVDDDLL